MLIQMANGLVHIDGLVIDSSTDAKAAVRVLVQFLAEKGVEAIIANGHVAFKENARVTPAPAFDEPTKVRTAR